MTIAAGPIGAGPIGSSGGANYALVANSGTFTLSMQGAAKLITDIYPSGTFILSGQALLTPVAYDYDIQSGSFTLTGQDVVTALGKGIVLEPIGTFTTTGHAVSFQKNLSPDAAVGSFTLTGQDQTYDVHVSLGDPVGTFTLTGNSVIFGFKIDAETGTFALTGQSATLRHGRKLSITDPQAFTYTGLEIKFRGWFSPTVPPAIWTDAA